MAALLAILAFAPRQRPIGQTDIDKAVEYALKRREPDPSQGSVAFEAVRPSVVRIKQLAPDRPEEREPRAIRELGSGTGVVIADTGLILTNHHVIAGAPIIKVEFFDGSRSEAEVVSMSPERDIAILQAKELPDDLKAATLRAIAGLKVGDPVYAVGFPFGIGPSFSGGVISGFDRSYSQRGGQLTGLIQFDAAANPGNSGGPLVDGEGQVVGLVTAIMNPTEQRVFIGIAFAVPIESATGGFALNPF